MKVFEKVRLIERPFHQPDGTFVGQVKHEIQLTYYYGEPDGNSNEWIVSWPVQGHDDYEPWHMVFEPTIPMAICKAALLSVAPSAEWDAELSPGSLQVMVNPTPERSAANRPKPALALVPVADAEEA